ncbi:hypothetical protein Purlil1_13029 [Purpureocillium lilacinum]|uniref:Alpha/beta hydrolase fold-3 domain-containing protein n=1 Tax=Purpureocillium lilacinum TaxID=33203 RepID=A0ABR0BF56_PURLI|nr:hypothetical protein Purlil1_13029 [Purpureocillium lilacinum]
MCGERGSGSSCLPSNQNSQHKDSDGHRRKTLQIKPRWQLAARAWVIQSAATLAFRIMNRRSPPVTKTIWLDSTLGPWKGKGKIRVDIWEPPLTRALGSRKSRPALINFHGGGFVLGRATDDARWISAAAVALDAVVFSVNYRLAPRYPFPTAVEDCADSIIYIHNHAEQLGVDMNCIMVSGFSNGGNLALASWILLQEPIRWGYRPISPPNLVGFALFYPLLDCTIGRPQKRLSCTRPDLTLPPALTDLFDASYIHSALQQVDMTDPRLSPGLMSDELLDRLPPVHLCLCEYDMLLAEGMRFKERLRIRNKMVNVRTVAGEKHAWDKRPAIASKGSIRAEYSEAIKLLDACLIARRR